MLSAIRISAAGSMTRTLQEAVLPLKVRTVTVALPGCSAFSRPPSVMLSTPLSSTL